jgi:hypothetical protein
MVIVSDAAVSFRASCARAWFLRSAPLRASPRTRTVILIAAGPLRCAVTLHVT